MNTFKQYFLLGLLVLTTGFTALPQSAKASPAPVPLDTVVAVVNDDVITQTELDQEVDYVKVQLKHSNTPLPSQAELETQVLNRMVDQTLELQLVTKMGIHIDDATLDKAIQTISAKNNMTVDNLKQTLAADQISFDFYRTEVRNQMLVQQLMQREVAPRVMISKQDVDNILNSKGYAQMHQPVQYNIEDILIALPDEPSSDELTTANQKANSIIAKLKAGANFNQLAVAQSNGGEALQGGALGWKTPEELPQLFVETVKTMQAGQVSAPIRAANGIHVLRLVDVKNNQEKHTIEETHARHILIKTDALHDDQTVRKEMENLKKQMDSGVGFDQLAEKYSQDPTSAIKGGDLGWVKPGDLVPPFEKAMDQLAVNAISDPVKSEFGWHLIQVLGRKEQDNTEEYRQMQIRRMLFESRMEDKTQDWLRRMRQSSYIKILLNEPNPVVAKVPEKPAV